MDKEPKRLDAKDLDQDSGSVPIGHWETVARTNMGVLPTPLFPVSQNKEGSHPE